ncbi:MAG: hypothetical protein JWM58_4202 [Rhizobium sp.]|nr:hypothetical protein [Rhizobium sp.]
MGEIKLSQEFEAIIQRQINSGHYDSATGVIAAGLSLLDALGHGTEDTPEGLSKAINDAFEDGTDDIPLNDAFAHIEKLYQQDMKARS